MYKITDSTFRVNIYISHLSTFGMKILFNALTVINFQVYFSAFEQKV